MKLRAILFAGAIIALIAAGMGWAIADDQPDAPSGPAAATAAVPPATATTPAPAASGAAAPNASAVRPTPPAAGAGAAPAAPSAQAAASTKGAAPDKPAAAPAPVRLSQAQLDQLLAPVALYPDQVLDQVLMASTYPLEVVEAARWIKIPAHRRLRGAALLASLKPLGLDPSVMALVPFPRLLDVMSEKLQWTEQLGKVFLAQQTDVLAAVQRLRREALAAGSLDPAKCRCKVVHRAAAIEIEPANPAVVYVPVCNPRVAYGAWPYPLYPPVVFPVPVRLAWAPVPFVWFYPVVPVAWYQPLWGWAGFDWWHGNVIVDASVYRVLAFGRPAFSGAVWVRTPYRGGIGYADPPAATAARFARAAVVGGAAGVVTARAAVRHVAVLRGARHHVWHGGAARVWHGAAAFRGGPRGGWHGPIFRGGAGFAHGAPHGGWFHGGPRMAGFHGGGRGGGGGHGRRG